MEDLHDVVLLGHSYGGMVVTGVADRRAERIRRLVYLDAFVPENGKCALDYIVPERAATFRKDGEQSGSITPPPLSLWGSHPARGYRILQAPRDETSLPHPCPTDSTRE
jgi:pimeloyl-ACP methyl ester carboxylesterase